MTLAKVLEPGQTLPSERQLFTNAALKAMILPLVVEQVLQMIVGIADTLMVSYAGEAAVSGVSLDTMIYTVFIYLFTAVATGGAVVVSQYIGHSDRKNGSLAASQIFFIGLAASLISVLLIKVFGNLILSLLYPSVEAEVMEACQIYLGIVAWSFPANAIYNAGAAIYRSMGRTRTTMLVSLSMNTLNIIGNAIGIFVLHAGAAGVAWPTTLSWYFAAVIMTLLCLNRQNTVFIQIADALRPAGPMIKRILHIAVPNAIEGTLFQLAKVILGSLISTFGTAQIAANGIGQTIWSLAACMGTSMNPVFITVIGQCMGAGDKEAADFYMHKLTRISLLLSFAWNVFVLALVPFILPLYSISAEAKHYVWIIVIIHNVFSATVQTYFGPVSNGLRAAGDVNFTMWSSLFCTVVCRTALSFFLGLYLGMGVVGIAWAMVIDWTIKAALDIWRWHSGKWLDYKII